ncbi:MULTISPECIES: gp16 family protein [unclassified Serratia (in: enterobacteria)]|uniref:gp16 family protein n=1 Tax=unclassified Serratia (in: enterobacteria) TaxID=2647522 RepID=UPI000467F33A|nr:MULTISPECIES: regulatory protein GemA [unclassified Serratia (in: enterobacteria)]
MNRAKTIQLIHIARNKLEVSDDAYRVMLQNLTGKDSCSKMDDKQLANVLAHLRGRGFKISGKFREVPMADFPMGRKIWVLWQDLAKAGLVRDKSQKALDAWLLGETGVARLIWLKQEPDQAHQAIEKLKQWLGRK